MEPKGFEMALFIVILKLCYMGPQAADSDFLLD